MTGLPTSPGALTAEQVDAHEGVADQVSVAKGIRWLTVSTVALSLLNYVYSLSLTHLLGVEDFAVFAAGQALLLTAGTVSSAAVPWVLAQTLAQDVDALRRRQVIWFGLWVNAVLGLGVGSVLVVLGLGFASPGTAAVIGGSGLLVFLSSSTVGLLEGDRRFPLLGMLRVGDSALKILVGVVLVLAGAGAVGALGGFAAGSLMLVAAGLWLTGRDLRPVRGAFAAGDLWRTAAGVGGVQALVSVLATLDLVLVAFLLPASQAATYQAAMILSRVPLFLAGAVSASVFPSLARGNVEASVLLRGTARVYVVMVVPYAIALATMPQVVLDLLFPDDFAGMTLLLPLTAVIGALLGLVNLLTTFFQAERRYVTSVVGQSVGVLVHAVALVVGAQLAGAAGLAVGGIIGTAVSVLALTLLARPALRRALVPSPGLLVGAGLVLALLVRLEPRPVLWFVVAAVVGVVAALLGLGRRHAPGSSPTPVPGAAGGDGGRRLRIVHLAFEDWRKPGSGGGAVRTREVNERLAREHDVTVLVSRYRGARGRVENGVRWVPVGLPLGYFGGMVSYLLMVPFAARRHEADVLVEDFAAPIGSVLPSLWHRAPQVAVVQWLNAEEKAAQYHLPFDRVQAVGVRRHRRFVAMSGDLGDRLREGNPDAEITVIPNGVPREAFDTTAERGEDVVFLGRLEIAQKGLDLLLEAYAGVAHLLPGDLVLVGDGPDRRTLERTARRLGLQDRVRFAGRLDGDDKLAVLAGARVVAMPSRFETFGMVAAEAMACGTPVVAFEIPSLREVVEPGTGRLVPAFDVAAFGQALVDVAADPEAAHEMGARGREAARRYDWDRVAAEQAAVYQAVASAGSRS